MTIHSGKAKILVWDAPVRMFHWLMVFSFTGAYLTAESERWRLIHVTLGYTMGGLVAFRLVWGFVGTRYARFSNFVRSAGAVKRYLKSLLSGMPDHFIGHNPAGAVAIVLLLLATGVIVISGVVIYNDIGGHFFEELHELSSNFMLLVVGIHVVGVLISSRLHRENLVRAMVTGRKATAIDNGITNAWKLLAVVVLLSVLFFWYLQWHSAPMT